MRFVENELDYIVDMLQINTNKWLETYEHMNKLKGDIGEKLIGYCICHGLWKLGYPLDLSENPYSYNIYTRLGADSSGYHGIDIFLTLVDSKVQKHILLIEVKNWRDYGIDEETFNNEMLSRFTKVDSRQEYSWILVYNPRHWKYLRERDDNYFIFTYNLAELITHYDVFDEDKIKNISRDFINYFCSLITEIYPEREYPYLKFENPNRPKWRKIHQDICMGVSNDIIELRYGTDKGYINQCIYRLKRIKPDIPDRRSKEWRRVWKIQS